ncbi:MAG: hypothetical protein JSR98_06485 [Proteobacteria bacterium]|nr:hypothetical protein [Pseudomonadota bacterium]
MSEGGMPARPQGADAKDRRGASWLSGMRLGRRAQDREAEAAMAEAVEAIARLSAISQAIFQTVEGSALPALEAMIVQAEATASDRRFSAAVRARMTDFKASAEHLRATFAALLEPEPAASPQSSNSATDASSGPPEFTGATISGLRVLAVEANGAHRLQLRAVLAQTGAEPLFVDDGAALIEAWRSEPWDVILFDAEVEGAMAAIQMIHAAEIKVGWSPTPLVALGGLRQLTDEEAAILDGHVTKPVSGPSLVAAVEAATAARPQSEPRMTVVRQTA